jgi:mono/diheme cytochrome c family protein
MTRFGEPVSPADSLPLTALRPQSRAMFSDLYQIDRVAFAGIVATTLIQSVAAASSPELTFERDVRPILKAHCFHCHGEEEEHSGGLDVRLRRFLEKGGESGAAIVPGKPDESLLLTRIRSHEMPPAGEEEASKRVPEAEIATLERWIASGAITARPEPEQLSDVDLITEEERSFWSFQPVQRPAIPDVSAKELVKTPIDAFILQKLEASGLSLSPEADRQTLIRRAYFDLIGLPPHPNDVQRFVEDDSQFAWQELIERLLASADYGDRWGRHWLDIAGYADSEGYTADDTERAWSWKYRDWVIQAINDDKPFDEFIREQLAGDEMVQPPYAELPPEDKAKLIATGFLRMAPDGTGGGADDLELAKNEVIAETIKVVSTSLLGLTVGCAQCHDHRYDPIPQSDYYRLRAIFEPAYNWKSWRVPKSRLISLYTEADKKQAAEIEAAAKKLLDARTEKQNEFINATFEKELAKLPETEQPKAREARDTPDKQRTAEHKEILKAHPSLNVSAGSLYLYDRKAADELQKMADEAAKLRETKPREEFVRALTEIPNQLPQTFLFYRGDHEMPKQQVEPAGLTVLYDNSDAARLPLNAESVPTSGRRLEWARRLTSGEHPLVARVQVNRFWMHHFGRGLVDTPGDLGYLGDRPTHAELLDWLADEFVTNNWSLKQFHRLVMTSAVYCQSSLSSNSPGTAIDPDDKLYWRYPMRRLDAEVVRDAVVAVSGKLNDHRSGPPVPVMADIVGQFVIGKENLNAGRPGPVLPMRGEEFRKSIYVQWRRSRPLTVLDAFDLPRMEPNCEKRNQSTVATQSLLLMNSGFLIEMSEHFAKRIRTESGEKLSDQVQLAWRLAFARSPSEDEIQKSIKYVESQTAHFEKTPPPTVTDPATKKLITLKPADIALASYCQLLLGSNQFLYVD